MALQVGESVGHYQIVEEIGAGGNGRVLKVEHLITRRREAMKILANGKPTSQEYAHRFLREIRLQASLDHPNIAAVLNAFWLEDDLVMVMELIDGHSLQKLISNRRLSLDQSLNIGRQVLNALAYAHANGVVHRDVSTSNIIVNDSGRLKLTDFGLAKATADLSLTDSGGMVGSPQYISPEQVRGSAAIDQRSDIYSTGVVLYELLTGSRPFVGESTFLLMQAHVQQPPQPPIERNAAIPHFLNDAILKALAKNPTDRFQTADAFLQAIDGPSRAAEPMPELVLLVAPPPAAPSHSYAAAIPDAVAVQAIPQRSLARRIWTSPVMGAILGIGVVVGAVAPVIFYDFETGRPRFGQRAATPRSSEGAKQKPASTAEPMLLTPGPKEVPVFSPGAGNHSLKPALTKRPVPTRTNVAPPIVVWGATTSPVNAPAVESREPTPAPARVDSPATVAPPPNPAAANVAGPAAVAPVAQRKGIFRRLADGVKALNPVRKETLPPEKQP